MLDDNKLAFLNFGARVWARCKPGRDKSLFFAF
jgi:hypothetical protein